ncbi:hypothetical protein JCM10450v2_002730 [Rhodotorula kratochvilovae]
MAAVLLHHPQPRLRLPRDTAPSPSPSRTRTAALFHTGSKLVKRGQRENRFIPSPELSHSASFGSAESLSASSGGMLAMRMSSETGQSAQTREVQPWEPDEEDDGWFDTHVPPGGLEPQPYGRDPQYFMSYSHSSLNMESLATSLLFANSLKGSPAHYAAGKAPWRVLDIGCGPTPFWILEMAAQEGWEKTRFVGLDAAPSSVTINLPASVEDRVSFIQHDLRERLPFQDASFDFIRFSCINFALREQDWQELCEEAIRVLKSGKPLEIVEHDHTVLRCRPDTSLDRFTAIDSLFSDILSDRFINPRPLTVLPSTLAMSGGTQLRSTGHVSLEMPTAAEHDLPTHPDAVSLADAVDPLGRYASGRASASRALRTDETRVLLHAYADQWASSSLGLAKAAAGARRRERSISGRQGSSILSSASTAEYPQKELDEVEDLVHAWADDLRGRADIASLLASQLDWEPTFDHALAASLESNVATCAAGLREVETHRNLHEEVFGEPDAELERRWQQMDYATREAEAELGVVKARMAGCGPALEQQLGTLDFEVFVVKAPTE